jgi:hypothetical protein
MGLTIKPSKPESKPESKPKSKKNVVCVDVAEMQADSAVAFAKGGMVGASDMSAKKMASPEKKKKMPQYYMGGGMIKKGKMYAYGGRVAKYKG